MIKMTDNIFLNEEYKYFDSLFLNNEDWWEIGLKIFEKLKSDKRVDGRKMTLKMKNHIINEIKNSLEKYEGYKIDNLENVISFVDMFYSSYYESVKLRHKI